MIGSMRASSFATLAMCAAVAGALATSATPARSEDKAMERTITVSATGSVMAAPDMAQMSAGVASDAPTAREALAKNTAAMSKVIAELKAKGIEAKDIQTSQFHVEPVYVYGKEGQPPRVTGYRVNNQVSVRVRDLAKFGDVLDHLVAVGANQVNAMSFDVSTADVLKDEARKLAVANARRRAELLAAAAGAELGAVMQIAEDAAVFQPVRKFSARAAMAEGAPVPVEAGESELEARVTVTWALK
ncbi:MAG: SIMPL domain-containing protein [Hyphomicrobium sp.]